MRVSTVLFLFVALLFVAADAHPQRPSGDPSAADKVAAWNGEKVTLLPTTPLACKSEEARLFVKKPSAGEREWLPVAEYAGRTGIVTRAVMGDFETEIEVTLDETAETVILSGDDSIGFDRELEKARAMIGKRLWSKGDQPMVPKDLLCAARSTREGDEWLRNLQQVTITDVQWGHHLQPIYVLLKADDGREGWLTGWDGYDSFDDRFHVVGNRGVPSRSYTYRFHTEDPRLTHPDWKAVTWSAIEAGEIAIGMTEEMAKMACGRDITVRGFILNEDGASIPYMYRCMQNQRRVIDFLVEKGKVTKYVE